MSVTVTMAVVNITVRIRRAPLAAVVITVSFSVRTDELVQVGE